MGPSEELRLRCDFWHPPVCLNYKSESKCRYGDRCHFRHTEADGQPSNKKSKKSGGKDQWRYLKENSQLGCVSQHSTRKSLFFGKLENWDRITQSSSPRPRCVTQKIGTEMVHRRESCKNAKLRSEFRGLQNSRKER